MLGRDTGRAMVRVAALGLNAADGEQRFPAHVDHVAPQAEREDGGLGEPEPAGADEHNPLVQPAGMKDLLHAAEPDLERQRHMIREHERPGARAAFAPIDGDEIDAAAAGRHQLREVGPEGGVADRRLDADRQPGGRRDGFDEIKQCVRGSEGAVRGGAGAVPITRDAAGLRDLRADLRPRQQAAGAGLGALTQFDLDRANLRTPRDGLLRRWCADSARWASSGRHVDHRDRRRVMISM